MTAIILWIQTRSILVFVTDNAKCDTNRIEDLAKTTLMEVIVGHLQGIIAFLFMNILVITFDDLLFFFTFLFYLSENRCRTTRKEKIKVNREASRRLRRGYQFGTSTESPHLRHRGQDHQNTEKTHTTQTDESIKIQRPERTGEMKMRDLHTTQIDTISILVANRVPLIAMTAIIGTRVRVMTAGGKKKAILPVGGGPTDIEVGTGATGLGTQSTAVVLHKTTTKILPKPTLRTK